VVLKSPWGNFFAPLVVSASNTGAATVVLPFQPHPGSVPIVVENCTTWRSTASPHLSKPNKSITEKRLEQKK
jgi:hypothetical protein